MKKLLNTSFFAGIIMIIMVLATHSTNVEAADEENVFIELSEFITNEESYFKNSWLEQSKQYYNLLQVCEGFKNDLISYGNLSYDAGYNKKDTSSIDLYIQYYDDCKQTAIDRLVSFTKRSFLVSKKGTIKSAKKLADLFETLPDGKTFCSHKYENGILDRKANAIYNREDAVAYAKEHAFDGSGACSDFVSRCLGAGGLEEFASKVDSNLKYKANSGFANVGTLGDALTKDNKYAKEVKVSGKTLNKNNYPEVEIGDVVIWKKQEGTHTRLHTAIISGFDSKGNALFCAHNSAHKDYSMGVNIYCGSYKTVPEGVTKYKWDDSAKVYRVMSDMYLYHIDY